MRKNADKIYAEVLYESLESAKNTDIVISNFLNMLKSKGKLLRMEKILKEFEKLYNQKEGIVSLKIKSARELDKNCVQKIIEALKIKKYELSEEVDAGLLGGFTAQYDDNLADLSIKNNLNKLHKTLKA